MATNQQLMPPATPCKYFQLGKCRFGSDCFFSHQIVDVPSKSERTVCRFYLAGTCNFGDQCFYEHTRSIPQAIKAQTSCTENDSSTSSASSASEESSKSVTISNEDNKVSGVGCPLTDDTQLLCAYFEKTLTCPYESACEFVHGDVCDICGLACLSPFDKVQNAEHRSECMQGMEKDMEEAFAVQRSSEKNCGICMEVVWDKENDVDTRFGILENCNHVFCLSCIRKWRASKSYENKIVKSCPECRVKSDFVTPNKFWFEDQESKKKIILDYKLKLGKTTCKYFKQGDGECPFGGKCFYLHQNKDGTLAELPEPTKRHRSNYTNGFGDDFTNLVTVIFDFSEDEDEELDVLEFFRNNIQWEDDTSDSDESELFDLSDEMLI